MISYDPFESKLDKVKSALRAGDEISALRIAAKFYELGKQKKRITQAWAAYQNPEFYRALKLDPDILFADGIQAIKERYLL